MWPAAGEEDGGSLCEPRDTLETEIQPVGTAGGGDEILLFALLASTHVTEMLPEFLPQRPISAPTEMGSSAWMWTILNLSSDSLRAALTGARQPLEPWGRE